MLPVPHRAASSAHDTPAEIPEKGPVPSPALSSVSCPAPLATVGLGTPYLLSTGPFLEGEINTSFPTQEIQLPPEPI